MKAEILAKTKAKITLIIGGARSGKSSLAEHMAAESGLPVVYLATAQAIDDEMCKRIAAHRKQRPKEWRTIEVNSDLIGALSMVSPGQMVLIDCLTVYVAGLLHNTELSDDSIEGHFVGLCKKLAKGENQSVIVTNEVGNGLVPPYPLGRRYRDILGRANQIVARAATEVYMMVAGIPVKIKG